MKHSRSRARLGRCAAVMWAVSIASAVAVVAIGGTAASEVSQQDAVAVASSVAGQLGLQWGEGATAAFKNADEERWRPARWELDFRGLRRMAVAADSGCVLWLLNTTTSDSAAAEPATEPIPKAQAVEIARKVVAAMGPADNLVLQSAELHEPTETSREWVVKWSRMWRGIPYHGPGAAVGLEAATGTLVSAGYYVPPPPPASAEVAVSEERAREVALGALRAAGKDSGFVSPEIAAKLMIVEPNGDFANPKPVGWKDPTRVAWVVTVTQKAKEGFIMGRVEIWVDAADGSVLGGVMSGWSPGELA